MNKKLRRRITTLSLAILLLLASIPLDAFKTTVLASTAGTDKSTITWSAAELLATATTPDRGMSLMGTWTNPSATDTTSFEDGFPIAGTYINGASAAVTAGGVAVDPTNAASGKAYPDAGNIMSYTAQSDGMLTIYTKINKGGKTLYVAGSDNSLVSKTILIAKLISTPCILSSRN